MNIREFSVRISIPMLTMAVMACTLTGRLLLQAESETTPTPSPAIEPTQTETPTVSRRPSATTTPLCVPPLGSEAMQSVQADADNLIPGSTVIWFDDFLCDNPSYGWGASYDNPNTKVTISGGVLTFGTREAGNIWDGLGRTEWNIQDRTGILVLFRSREDTIANLFISTGTWQTSDFRRWGFEIRPGESSPALWSGFEGTTWLNGDVPPKLFQPDVWYYLLIRLGEAGDVTMKVWEKDRAGNHADFRRTMNASWTGRRWWSLFQVYDGTIQIDRYWEAAYAGEK
jgi:hypothetical protein